MSERTFEGLYNLAFDEYRFRAHVLVTMVEAFNDATDEMINETPSECWETLARLLNLQITEAENFILDVDIETLLDIVEAAQKAFDKQEAEAAEEAARRDEVK